MSDRIVLVGFLLLISVCSFGREGMWIPSQIGKNITEMQQMGFKLTSADIYNADGVSMKDAIVHFGAGCTGELISPDGLLVTNYHCGYSNIQSHSSLENDYLTNGFWAMSREQELPNPGLSVTFLIRMEDVTSQVFEGTDSLKTEKDIEAKIQDHISTIVSEEKRKTGYNAVVEPFFEGNQYFLLLTETFSDVRLVGAPPSSIGKFGGDTDNWVWPRHTGDFSLFRIYAGKDNKPAVYSPDNIPYHPRKFFPVNISGIKEGDFTMVFGYPGTTQQYIPSQRVKLIMENSDPNKVVIRDVKLKILSGFMEKDPLIRIQYAAKYASISNAWKKWQGEMLGLKHRGVVAMKEQQEQEFTQWVGENESRKLLYGNILSDFDQSYSQIAPYQMAYDYYTECFYRGAEAYKNYLTLSALSASNKLYNVKKYLSSTDAFFKDYSSDVDFELFVQLIEKYNADLSPEYLPAEMKKIFSKGDERNYFKKIFNKSVLTNKEKMMKIVADSTSENWKSFQNDPLYKLFDAVSKQYNNTVRDTYNQLNRRVDNIQKKYMEALLEMKSGQMIYPDANSTLRVSYGKVEGFRPRDGVIYNYYTTLDGVLEKEDPDIFDYQVPDRLKELCRLKDFGHYSLPDSTLPVCFTASNHTTGGNSGSPVIDANGYLIGINFDRGWEGTMSDIKFDTAICRNISLDVRYLLFIIDKFAGAGYLLDEMKIIR